MESIKKLILRSFNRETFTYVLFGGLTTLLGISLYWCLIWLGYGVILANTVSTVLAVLFAYITNKCWVFLSTSWHYKTLLRELITFCGGRLATYMGETVLLVLLVDRYKMPSLPCKLLTTVVVVIGNYIISKKAVFNKTT